MIQVSLRNIRVSPVFWLTLTGLLAACDPADIATQPDRPEPGVIEGTRNGPADAPDGTCWGRTVSPAIVQTITQQIQIEPAKINSDGSISAPPKYRTDTTQEIVTPRVDNWFETPCAEILTEEFNASLQRALVARGFYQGDITGKMDPATRAAVQAFQRLQGRDSSVLAVETARALGLIAVPRTPSEQ